MAGAIRRIRAVNYRCLRDVDVALDDFNILVGANGSGKSAMFDTLLFVRDSLVLGVVAAVEHRTNDFRDLVWGRPDGDPRFELIFELDIPKAMREEIPRSYHRFTVSLSVCEVGDGNLSGTLTGCLKPSAAQKEDSSTGSDFFPGLWKTDMRFDSTTVLGPMIRFEHPLVTRLVMDTFLPIRELVLDSRLLRQASKPPKLVRPTPSRELPWIVQQLRRYPDRYQAWLQHIRTAIADLRDIDVKVRADDRHSYLVATYSWGLKVPSWSLSDGTLRLLALTIIAYLPAEGRMYLVEEPENGVHPLAIEAIYRSLSSSYDAQVLLTTHSPVLLACTEPQQLLCFSARDGETKITSGNKHPHLLQHWQSAADVDLLFAPEVLG